MTRDDLQGFVLKAISKLGGKATIVAVAEDIWKNYETDLKASGDLFYTWQYDMRWAAQRLAKAGKLRYGKDGTKNVWEVL